MNTINGYCIGNAGKTQVTQNKTDDLLVAWVWAV